MWGISRQFWQVLAVLAFSVVPSTSSLVSLIAALAEENPCWSNIFSCSFPYCCHAGKKGSQHSLMQTSSLSHTDGGIDTFWYMSDGGWGSWSMVYSVHHRMKGDVWEGAIFTIYIMIHFSMIKWRSVISILSWSLFSFYIAPFSHFSLTELGNGSIKPWFNFPFENVKL